MADFAARHFGCLGALALKAVHLLATADHALRRCRIPQLCLRLRLDRTLS